MSEFYRQFEERHRGSQELIMSRLRQYELFVRPISKLISGTPALDLGCGRGEWLRVLSELGMVGHGVDLDDSMLEAARSSGLSVTTDDAITYLERQPDESLSIVSAFHLVEHLPFKSLEKLVAEAHRCLVPGGLIILETPNPENIVVAAANFYLDPTHIRPIPPLLLSFLVEVLGFTPVKIVRLQEPEELRNRKNLSILDVLGGVSPDYSIVAQKSGSIALARAVAPAFCKEFGLDLLTLASRYDKWITEQSRSHFGRSDATWSEADHLDSLTKQLYYLLNRSTWEKLLFLTSGKPRMAINRLLFHKDGHPRRALRSVVLDTKNQPRRALRMWMMSREYQSLPQAFPVGDHSKISPFS